MDILENLRLVKSSLEGSEVKFTSPEVSQTFLQDLRQLTLMHIPSSVTESVRENYNRLIKKTFQGTKLSCLEQEISLRLLH